MSVSGEFKKKLQKQEGWYVEGENFDILTAREKKDNHYRYTISLSLSKKHKLFRKARKEKIEFAGKLFYEIEMPNYGIYRYEEKNPIVVSYDFPEGFNSLNTALQYAMKAYEFLMK